MHLDEAFCLHEFSHALANVEQYYLGLHESMNSDSIRDQILLKPDQTHARLLRSFNILRNKQILLKPDQTHTRLLRSFNIIRTKQIPGHIAEKKFNICTELAGIFTKMSDVRKIIHPPESRSRMLSVSIVVIEPNPFSLFTGQNPPLHVSDFFVVPDFGVDISVWS